MGPSREKDCHLAPLRHFLETPAHPGPRTNKRHGGVNDMARLFGCILPGKREKPTRGRLGCQLQMNQRTLLNGEP